MASQSYDLPTLIEGLPGITAPPDPGLSEAIAFDGTGRLDIAVGELLRAATPAAPATVTLWVRPRALQADSRHPEVLLSAVVGQKGWELVLDGRFKLRLGDGQELRLRYSNAADQPWPEVDRWTHVAVVLDHDGVNARITLWADGQQVMSRTHSASAPLLRDIATRLSLGNPREARPESGGFRGRMAALAVHEGALDQAAIQALRDAALHEGLQAHLDDALIAHLRLTELDRDASGLFAADDSGNGRDLRLPEGTTTPDDGARIALALPPGAPVRIPAPNLGMTRNEEIRTYGAMVWLDRTGFDTTWRTVLASGPPGSTPAWALQANRDAVRLVYADEAGHLHQPERPTSATADDRWVLVGFGIDVDTDTGDNVVRIYVFSDHGGSGYAGRVCAIPDVPGVWLGDPDPAGATLRLHDLRLFRSPLSLGPALPFASSDKARALAEATGLRRRLVLEAKGALVSPAADGTVARYPLSADDSRLYAEAADRRVPASPTGTLARVDDPAGSCLAFGPSSSLELPFPGAVLTAEDGARAVAVSAWVRTTFAPTMDEAPLFVSRPEGGASDQGWAVYAGPRRLRLVLGGEVDRAEAVGAPVPELTAPWSPGTWTHVAVALSQTAEGVEATLHVDGAASTMLFEGAHLPDPAGPSQLAVGVDRLAPALLHLTGLRVFATPPSEAALEDARHADRPDGLDAVPKRLARARLVARTDLPHLLSDVDDVAGPGALTIDSVQAGPDPWLGSCARFMPSGSLTHAVKVPTIHAAGDDHLGVWAVSFWVRAGEATLGAATTLIQAGSATGEWRFVVRQDHARRFEVTVGDHRCIATHAGRSTHFLRRDRWTHVAVSVLTTRRADDPSAQQVRLFLDGYEVDHELANAAHEGSIHLMGVSLAQGSCQPAALRLGPAAGEPSDAAFADLRVYAHALTRDDVLRDIAETEASALLTLAEARSMPFFDLPLERVDGLTLEDISGHGHHGTLPDGSPAHAIDDNPMGRALDFAAGSGAAVLTTSLAFPDADGSALTVEVWIKPFLPIGADDVTFLELFGSAGWRLSVGSAFTLRNAQGQALTGGASLRGSWQHVAAVFRETQDPTTRSVTLYVDGVQVATAAVAGQLADCSGLSFGDLGGTVPFSGRLAFLRGYDRALSATEVAHAYAGRRPGPAPTTSHYLDFSLHDRRQEPVIYLLDSPQTLQLDLVNASPSDIVLPLLPSGGAAEGSYQLALRLRAGVLRESGGIVLTGPDGVGAAWVLTPRDTAGGDYAVSLCISAVGTGTITLPAGARWTFTLANVQPEPDGGTRGTRIQLRWTGLKAITGAALPDGTRLHYLLLNHSKHPSAAAAFPLSMRLAGAPFVPTGEAGTDASLTLDLFHDGSIPLPMPTSVDPERPPQVRIAVPVSTENTTWALARPGAVTFSLSTTGSWEQVDDGDAVLIRWKGASVGSLAWRELDAVDLGATSVTITGLGPGLLSGASELRIGFENFLDLDDPTHTMADLPQRVLVTKAPIWIADRAPTPPALDPRKNTLTRGGTAPAVAVDGPVSVWNNGRIQLHEADLDLANAATQTPDGALYAVSQGSTRGLHVEGQHRVVVQALDGYHQLRLRSSRTTEEAADATEIREFGDVHISTHWRDATGTTAKTTTFSQDGTTTFPGTIAVAGSAGGYPVPAGTIVMWSGASNAIPAGWALCDKNNGTPDLRGRFIVGANPTAGGDFSVGYHNDGRSSVTLQEAHMPRHSHGVTAWQDSHTHYVAPSFNARWGTMSGNGHECLRQGSDNMVTGATTTSSQPGIHVSEATKGSGQAFDPRPAYYAICFIMKL